MKRVQIIAEGRVQGVGFRYFCQSIASSCKVTGWVQNQYDGSVVMEAQGADHRVDLFVEEVRKGNRFARVRGLFVREIPLVDVLDEKSFRVRY